MKKTESYKIKTIVVEDEEKILEHICNKITALDSSFEIIATAHNGQDAIEKIVAQRPHVVFTDISMPVMDGMQLIQQVKQLCPNTRIVIISGYSDFSYAQQAIKYGVFNYLLKPLKDDLLLETLFDIKQTMSQFFLKQQRHITYSDNYQLISDKKAEFMIVAVCVGNVIYSTQDEEVNDIYLDRMWRVSWNEVMDRLCGNQEWFVSDEHTINQKIVGVKIEHANEAQQARFAKDLQTRLKKETHMPVSICCVREKVEQPELWEYVKRLRNIMKKKVVIGESSIFYLEEEENSRNDMIEIIKMQLNLYVKNYFITTDLEKFKEEMKKILHFMKRNHSSQENVEKICIYLLKLLEFSNQGYEHHDIEELQDHMMKMISLAMSEEELFENLVQVFEMEQQDSKEAREEHEMKDLLAYVDEHYLTIHNMEEVAIAFGYSYAYLSRLFKKRMGETMNRYITRKKVALAKELLQNRSDLKVSEISNMCGYHDGRYFSRVFKGEIGITPLEYKEKVDKK